VVQTTQKSASQRPARAPISAHPLFAAMVALWFAALLGLGSAVLPRHVVESLVGASGLPAFLPAAAPPLGLTARVLIAVAASGLGVLIGLVIARRIAAAQRTGERATGGFASLFGRRTKVVRPPLSIRDALGDNTPEAAEPAPHAGRRRALAIVEEDLAFDETAVPGEVAWTSSDEADAEWPEEHDAPADDTTAPAFAAPEAEAEAEAEEEAPSPPAVDRDYDPAPAFAAPDDAPPPAFSAVPLPIMQRPLDQLGMAELVERLAHAIQDRQGRTRAADAPFSGELAEAAMPIPAALRPIAFDSPDGYEDDAEDAPFSLPLGRQDDAFTPLPAHDRKPFSTAGLTPATPDDSDGEEETEEEEDGDADDAGYSSLLNLQPFQPRDEDAPDNGPEDDSMPDDAPEAHTAFQPTALAPRPAAASPADTEQALRDALANLQRISGAA